MLLFIVVCVRVRTGFFLLTLVAKKEEEERFVPEFLLRENQECFAYNEPHENKKNCEEYINNSLQRHQYSLPRMMITCLLYVMYMHICLSFSSERKLFLRLLQSFCSGHNIF